MRFLDALWRLALAIPLMFVILILAAANDGYYYLRHWFLGEPLPPVAKNPF